MKKALVFVCSAAILIAAWYFLAKKINAPLILPSPKAVSKSILKLIFQKKFAAAFFATLKRCSLSFFLSLALGSIAGLLFSFFPVCSALFEPVLSLVRSVPVVSLILLALFWLKSDGVPVFIAFLMTFPVVTTGFQSAFSKKNDEELKLQKMADSFSFSPLQKLLFLHLPLAFPAVSSAIKTASGMIWKLVCAGEVLSFPRNAVGSFLHNAQIELESADMFALTLIIVFSSGIFCAMIHFFLIAIKKAGRIVLQSYFLLEIASKKEPEKIAPPIFIKHLSLKYDSFLYDDFCVDFTAGSLTVILAPSGLGKTTLLDFIAEKMRTKGVSYLFQEPRLLPNLTVLENVALPLCRFFGGKKAKDVAKKMLFELELGEKLNSFPKELSGGEKQRTAMARALCFPSSLLLLDEPFQSQDFSLALRLINIVKKCALGKTAVIVTHNPHEAAFIGGRILILKSRPAHIALDLDCTTLFSSEEIERRIIKMLLE